MSAIKDVNCMTDLETLGKRPGCKILSIGAVVFGPTGLGAEFYQEVLREPQPGLHEDPETIAWWENQSAEARDRLFAHAPHKVTLSNALHNFNMWLLKIAPPQQDTKSVVRIWGNGADFDNAILQVAYAETAIMPPVWQFWNNRCYRTLKALRPAIKLVRTGTYHNALDDAKSQAEHAVRLLTAVDGWQA